MALIIVCSCVAAVLLLLCVPIHVDVTVQRKHAVRSRLHVSWLFGLVRFRIRPGGERKRPKKAKTRSIRRRRVRTFIGERVARGLRHPGFRARCPTLLRDVFGAIRLRDMQLHARIGLPDPADTGQLWAILVPFSAQLSCRGIQLEPAFDEACFRFLAAARIRFIPVQVFS